MAAMKKAAHILRSDKSRNINGKSKITQKVLLEIFANQAIISTLSYTVLP